MFMAGSHDLHVLRRRIGAITAIDPERRGSSIAFGEEDIDNALPDHGLARGAVHELLPESQDDFAATLGFGLGLLTRLMRVCAKPVLWAGPARETFRCGIAYPVGLAAFGFDPARLHYLSVDNAQDVLWAMEEALASASLAAVVGILPAKDKSYDFTSSRRLSLRAAASGVTAFLVRQGSETDKPTAAVTRWSIAARQSAPQWRRGLSMPGLGPPRWRASLMKCKRGRPRSWPVEWDHETFSFRLASPLADRAPAVAEPAAVVPFRGRRRAAS
jgi:protein ImuA